MAKAKRNQKKEAREKLQEKQGKQMLFGFAIIAIVLVVLMFIYYSNQV
ncbi:MAG: serine incorporator domain-containing protein [Bacteroidaceae bacterium]|jgi:hypothetical protein|nr:serine incorporator domain-containing protein [Bacteroidaceae bacterium]